MINKLQIKYEKGIKHLEYSSVFLSKYDSQYIFGSNSVSISNLSTIYFKIVKVTPWITSKNVLKKHNLCGIQVTTA